MMPADGRRVSFPGPLRGRVSAALVLGSTEGAKPKARHTIAVHEVVARSSKPNKARGRNAGAKTNPRLQNAYERASLVVLNGQANWRAVHCASVLSEVLDFSSLYSLISNQTHGTRTGKPKTAVASNGFISAS